MESRDLSQPTRAELGILRVLWSHGPSTVREVHEALKPPGAVRYTTVLKLLQNMTEKGLVVRDEAQRAHIYTARLTEGDAQRHLIGDLLDQAFGGSTAKLVMRALAQDRASEEELDEIRTLLDRLEEERDGGAR